MKTVIITKYAQKNSQKFIFVNEKAIQNYVENNSEFEDYQGKNEADAMAELENSYGISLDDLEISDADYEKIQNTTGRLNCQMFDEDDDYKNCSEDLWERNEYMVIHENGNA